MNKNDNFVNFKQPLWEHQKKMVLEMEYWEESREKKITITQPYTNHLNNERSRYRDIDDSMLIEQPRDIIIIKSDMALLTSKTGSGKTRTVLALIARNKVAPKYNYNYNMSSINFTTSVEIIRNPTIVTDRNIPNLIIANHSLIPTVWEVELAATNIKYYNISTPKKMKNITAEFLCQFQVVLLSNKYQKDLEIIDTNNNNKIYKYDTFQWNRVIIDEFDRETEKHIYNYSFLWLISATFPYGFCTNDHALQFQSDSLPKWYLSRYGHKNNNNVLASMFNSEDATKNNYFKVYMRYLTVYCDENFDTVYVPCIKNRFIHSFKKPINLHNEKFSDQVNDMLMAGEYFSVLNQLGSSRVDNIIDAMRGYFDNEIRKINVEIQDIEQRIVRYNNNLIENEAAAAAPTTTTAPTLPAYPTLPTYPTITTTTTAPTLPAAPVFTKKEIKQPLTIEECEDAPKSTVRSAYMNDAIKKKLGIK